MSGNTNSDILIAGAIAAFTVDLLVYPLDTIKTRIQSPDYAKFYTDGQTGKVAFFTTYERTKTLFTRLNTTSSITQWRLTHRRRPRPAHPPSRNSSPAPILTPAEVIKQNAQMVKAGSPTNATMQTLTKFKSNPLALWRGYTALAGRNLPFTAMQFPMFERLKLGIKEYRDRRGLTTGTIWESGSITAVSAGSAGAVAAVITTPIDVVKTRIMLSAADNAAQEASQAQAKPKAGGLVDAFGKSVESSKDTVKKAAKSLHRCGAVGAKK
ncbi:hypothetical protein SNOG_07206 [Parastagonospora nodorum SN15]|uniref:Uncharacterized protein n=1 Tax=Phaeosphaeria nodorum (strain SN15 / ATCC MYA-4574 / FGSC 10173) TaxID=321614 RepID=Q0UM08_PHANO|nr:hypothetical protein SNOG_07206 [Parastagonospora nodorum SN15]EAT85857.1 hypothetical protein SNOG_07206 [Parastagonospora nodorum SN15]